MASDRVMTIKEYERYTFIEFLAEFGGHLGLFLGSSVLSLFEFLAYFMMACHITYLKMKRWLAEIGLLFFDECILYIFYYVKMFPYMTNNNAYLIGRNFVGQNFWRAKLFVWQNFRPYTKNSSLSPDEKLSLVEVQMNLVR